MIDQKMTRRRRLPERLMRARRWHRAERGSLRARLWHLAVLHHRWYDWGGVVMTLTGREFCGNYDVPKGRHMWYRVVNGKFECKLRGEWFGVRRWLYFKALHAHVERKIPFTCQVTPDRGSGGYDHWHCQLKRRHEGKHRFNMYTWIGSGFGVEHEPADA